MTVMYSFCFCFSVRLGAIIVAIFSALPSLSGLIASCIGYANPQQVTKDVSYFSDNRINCLFLDNFWNALKTDPGPILETFVGTLTVHLLSCICLIIGAFKCYLALIIFWLVLDFIRLVFLSTIVITAVLIAKVNEYDLGVIIATSIVGGFLIIYLWYQWLCVISLCQIIRQIRKMNREVTLGHKTFPPNAPGTYRSKLNHVFNRYDELPQPN